jgi:hypothetical protein
LTKPTTKPNAATQVEARYLSVLRGVFLLVSVGHAGHHIPAMISVYHKRSKLDKQGKEGTDKNS